MLLYNIRKGKDKYYSVIFFSRFFSSRGIQATWACHDCVSLTDCIMGYKNRGFIILIRIPKGPSNSQLQQEIRFNFPEPKPERLPLLSVKLFANSGQWTWRDTVAAPPWHLSKSQQPLFFPGTEGSLLMTDEPGSLWSFQRAVKAAAAQDDAQQPHGE